jgi:Mor family transcriptional regulator
MYITDHCKRRITVEKKTMISLNLSPVEQDLLAVLSEKKDISKSAVLRQGLRILGLLQQRTEQGEKFYFEAPDKQKSEILLP